MGIKFTLLSGTLLALTPIASSLAGDISGCVVFHQNNRTWPASLHPVTLKSTSTSGQYRNYTGQDGCYYFRDIENGSFKIETRSSIDQQSAAVVVSGPAKQEAPLIRLRW
ncbi:MAG: hypothetical protein ACR2PG_03085 [Hyphomicrobiaceae bacterium]